MRGAMSCSHANKFIAHYAHKVLLAVKPLAVEVLLSCSGASSGTCTSLVLGLSSSAPNTLITF
eukprot:15195-Heterococcus_DN1.PRE.2